MSDLFIANSDDAAGDTILDGTGGDDDDKIGPMQSGKGGYEETDRAIGEEDIDGEGNDVTIDLRYKTTHYFIPIDCGVFIKVDIAAAGATNSLIITDDVDAADPTFMISVTFDRDQN